MYAFTYHRPDSVRKAASLLTGKDDAKLIAGGQTLLPTMKQRLASPGNLIDLRSIPGLNRIEQSGRSVVIGAMTPHADVAASEAVRNAIPALAELAGMIGDPAADYPAACVALGATIVTNKRKLAADDYFTGLFETALEEGEIVTEVRFPVPTRAAYVKFRQPASRFALVGVFVAKRGADVRVAVTGAGSSGVFRVAAFEAALQTRFAAKSLDGLSVSADNINSDIHASADYRAHLIGVLAKRAVAAAK